MAKEQTNIPLAPYLRVPKELSGLDVEHRVRFWKLIGKEGLYLKRQEILKGLDKWGAKFLPVKRKWGVKVPLIPHSETSRTYDLLSLNSSAYGATLFWRAGGGKEPWSKVLGYHAYKHGPRSLPVRNVFGLSPESEKQLMVQSEIWESGFKAGLAAATKRMTASVKTQPETRLERILRQQSKSQTNQFLPIPTKKEAAEARKRERAEAVARRKAEAVVRKSERAEAARKRKLESEARAKTKKEKKRWFIF